MELLKQYIEGLNACIAAGVDVRTVIKGKAHPIIRTIIIDEEEWNLHAWYLGDGRDRRITLPITTQFTVEFNDLPDDIRDWKVITQQGVWS